MAIKHIIVLFVETPRKFIYLRVFPQTKLLYIMIIIQCRRKEISGETLLLHIELRGMAFARKVEVCLCFLGRCTSFTSQLSIATLLIFQVSLV